MIYQTKPNYDHIKVSGSLCYAKTCLKGGDKFASRSRHCVFVGYLNGKKAWTLYDLEKRDFFESRDVVFYEEYFPLQRGELVIQDVAERRVEGPLGSCLPNVFADIPNSEASTNSFLADQPMASTGLDARGATQFLNLRATLSKTVLSSPQPRQT